MWLPDGIKDPLEASKLLTGEEASQVDQSVYLRALEALAATPMVYPGDDGIDGMIVCGGGKYWPGVIIAVRMLREYSDLPIEVWHRDDEIVYPDDLADVPDVKIVNASDYPYRILNMWEIKLHAIINCRFRNVLYVDADAYVVSDPAKLLDLAQKRAFVYWSDTDVHLTSIDWKAVWPKGNRYKVAPVQGGQVIINRKEFWRELVISHWLCQHADYYFTKIYGDQDAWRLAINVTGGPFLHLGKAEWRDVAFVCNLNGYPQAVHRCHSKLFRLNDMIYGDRQHSVMFHALPDEDKVFNHLASALKRDNDSTTAFGHIYTKGLWTGIPGDSGSGSIPAEAEPYINLVNGLLMLTKAESLVDLGCGDGRVIGAIHSPYLKSITGVDCHGQHVSQLAIKYPDRKFVQLDVFKDREKLPPADIALMKDVLQHWPNSMILEWLAWILDSKKYKAMILTNDRNQVSPSQDSHLGGFRPLDSRMAPLKRFKPFKLLEYTYKSSVLLHCAE